MQAALVLFDVVSNQPTITAWPNASAIIYGQPLSASALSGGSAEVLGTFAFNDPEAILPAGSHNVAVTFTPDDEVTYASVTGSATVEVAMATPVVTAWPSASVIEEGQALSASTLTGGDASTAGSFAFLNPSYTPLLGSYVAAVRFMPADVANFNPVDGSVNVVVQKPAPSITAWPTASGLVYGQALSASTLSGGSASESGTFSFDAPATTPNAGAYGAAVTFTPTDTANYSAVRGSVTVQVAKATPVITAWPTASAVDHGQYLGATSLNGGSASVPGAFAFDDPEMQFNGQDAFTFSVSDGVYTSDPATVSINGGEPQAAPEADPLAESFEPNLETVADRITDLYVTCDNGYEVYVNGTLLGTGSNWQSAGRYQNTLLQVGRNVVAIKGTDAGGVAALLVEMVVNGQRIGSGSSWKRSLTAPADWKTPGFDDSAWVAATEYGAYGVTPWNKNVVGMPTDTPAKWIWSSNNDLENTVYFRYVIDVVSPNRPPTANAQGVTVEPGTPTAIILTGNDPDDDPLAFEIVTPPAFGALTGTAPNLTYTPPALPAVGMHQVTVIFTPTDAANYHSVTGTVSVSVGGGGSIYQNWAAQYSGHDLSDPHGDNDGDGLSNFHEFAFGLNPTNGNSNNPIIAPFDKATRSFSYTRRADSGLTYTVCISPDLKDWEDLPPAQVTEVVAESAEPGAETVGVTLELPDEPENLFLRVKAD